MVHEPGQPRTRCRLPCIVRIGRKRIHARVFDVSSGGLCIVAPVSFRLRTRLQVEIVEPRYGPFEVEGEVRHQRPVRQPSSGRRGWATGLALVSPAPAFLTLTGQRVPPRASQAGRFLVAEQSLYRVRLKALDSARTRTLMLRAVSESAVREAVLRDLPGDWCVLDVEADPVD